MECPTCHAAVEEQAATCPSCGGPLHAAAPTAAQTARDLGAQLDQARRSLPYGSIHVAAAGFAVPRCCSASPRGGSARHGG